MTDSQTILVENDISLSRSVPDSVSECLSSATLVQSDNKVTSDNKLTSDTLIVERTISGPPDSKYGEYSSSETPRIEEDLSKSLNTEDNSQTILIDTDNSDFTLSSTENSRKPSDSKLFNMIKERYERNTVTSTSEDTPREKIPRKVIKDFQFLDQKKSQSCVDRYPDLILKSNTNRRNKTTEQLSALHNIHLKHSKDIKEKDDDIKSNEMLEHSAKLKSTPQYTEPKKVWNKKIVEEKITGGGETQDEKVEKLVHQYENIKNDEESIVVTPRRKKHKMLLEEKSPRKKEKEEGSSDQHLYEEIIPCHPSREEVLPEQEHIYDELKKPEKSNFLHRLKSSFFRFSAAVTPWWVARRYFWRNEKIKKDEYMFSEISRRNSKVKMKKIE